MCCTEGEGLTPGGAGVGAVSDLPIGELGPGQGTVQLRQLTSLDCLHSFPEVFWFAPFVSQELCS